MRYYFGQLFPSSTPNLFCKRFQFKYNLITSKKGFTFRPGCNRIAFQNNVFKKNPKDSISVAVGETYGEI